jgi:hypothetical protein
MTASRSWDRAAALPVPIDQRRLPEIAALAAGLPSVPALFDFMRDAELRFATLRMRIVETAQTARGEVSTTLDVVVRHPGQAKVTTTGEAQGGRADYDIWISDGEVVRTYAVAHHLGTQRPIRNRPRGLTDDDIPGPSQVYEPLTPLPAETLPDALVHPAGLCQNVLTTGRCTIVGTELVGGREAVILECDHPRATQIGTDRPDYRIAISVDRETGVILRFVESIDGRPTRHAEVVVFEPDAALQPSALQFVFPSGTTMLY